MRWLLVGVGALALAACGPRPDESKERASLSTFDAAEVPPGAGARAPGIDVTAAPGVAFTYRNGFRLPSEKIAAVQEAHAQACEQLGVARCRITGMRYRLLGEHNIEGELLFKLAPELARTFARQGTARVEAAGGTLVDAEITGTDAGAVIGRAGTDRARASDELKRLDAAIAAARTGAERAELQSQRADITRRIVAATDTASDARESLATTPVSFRYESGPAVRGFDTSAPFTSAINTGIASVETTLAIVLALLAVFGPPALVVGLIIWGFFALRRRLRGRRPIPALDGPPVDVTV